MSCRQTIIEKNGIFCVIIPNTCHQVASPDDNPQFMFIISPLLSLKVGWRSRRLFFREWHVGFICVVMARQDERTELKYCFVECTPPPRPKQSNFIQKKKKSPGSAPISRDQQNVTWFVCCLFPILPPSFTENLKTTQLFLRKPYYTPTNGQG